MTTQYGVENNIYHKHPSTKSEPSLKPAEAGVLQLTKGMDEAKIATAKPISDILKYEN